MSRGSAGRTKRSEDKRDDPDDPSAPASATYFPFDSAVLAPARNEDWSPPGAPFRPQKTPGAATTPLSDTAVLSALLPPIRVGPVLTVHCLPFFVKDRHWFDAQIRPARGEVRSACWAPLSDVRAAEPKQLFYYDCLPSTDFVLDSLVTSMSIEVVERSCRVGTRRPKTREGKGGRCFSRKGRGGSPRGGRGGRAS